MAVVAAVVGAVAAVVAASAAVVVVVYIFPHGSAHVLSDMCAFWNKQHKCVRGVGRSRPTVYEPL